MHAYMTGCLAVFKDEEMIAIAKRCVSEDELGDALKKRIKIAVQIMKEATKAIAAMPFIMFFPAVTVALTVIVR